MWCLTLTVIFSAWICSVHGGNPLKYSSSCSVDLCTLNNVSNGNNTGNSSGNITCLNTPLCYSFDTSLNTSICAPAVICSLFDPCSPFKRCATNNSVCVINTCCAAPICMPLSLTGSCSMYTSNNTRAPSWSSTICPNATWAANSTLAVSNYLNNNYWANFGDFVIDNYNNLYVIESSSYSILKFALNNTAVYNIVAFTNFTSAYQAQNVFVDSNGTIYTAETYYSGMGTLYQVVKYNQSSLVNGTVVFGPTTCGTALNQMCGSAGLFVDLTGSIYYADSSNHRVLKITPFSSSASVVAGTSGMSGSALNQLNSPAGIYVDGNGALYVADQNNYRVMKFASGSSIGSVLFSFASYQAPNGLILDNAGGVYVGTYSGIFKWVPGSSNPVQVASQTQMYMSGNRVRLDTYGNIYTSGYMNSNIVRYNITSNIC